MGIGEGGYTLLAVHAPTGYEYPADRRTARILEGRWPNSGSQYQKGVRGVTPGKFL